LKAETLVNELLKEKKIAVHQVAVRVKSLDSLTRKLEKKRGKYSQLSDLTDIVGVRIIVYLENEVDLVAQIIDNEFFVDTENSIDKRNLKIDTFGYRSLHYVAGLSKERSGLTENRKFAGLKAEIQIRSVLQHAWAEIEHDIGYKGEKEIPEQYKRTFHRVAALLESADLEFVRLKNDLAGYEKEVSKTIKSKPNTVKIDKASITSYLISSKLVRDMDQTIIEGTSGKSHNGTELVELILIKSGFFHFVTIKDLDDSLHEHKAEVTAFAIQYLSNSNSTFGKGISIFYLFYYLAAKTENINNVNAYLQHGGAKLGKNDFATVLLAAYKELRGKINIVPSEGR
jgi:ppGpp synthetase/RelA/SpoT-type nucleotidyltranferase